MNILVVSAVLPYPLYSGGQIRLYNLLRILSRKHDIHLVSYIRDDAEKSYLTDLSFLRSIETIKRGGAWQVEYILRTGFSTYPFLYETYRNDDARKKIHGVILREKIDIIHIEPSYIWLGLPKTSVPIVAVEHNIEHEVYARYAHHARFSPTRFFLNIDVEKMARAEERIWHRVASIISVSEENKKYIAQKAQKTPVYLVRNGVDLRSFPFCTQKKQGDPVFLYVGNFSWMENRDAVEYLVTTLWPEILKKYPSSTLKIVGKSMPLSLEKKLKGKNAVYLSHVERIQDELSSSTIMLAPIRIGGGTKYKILEALSMGLPVITTAIGAEGLHVCHKEHLYIADSAKEVLTAIGELLSSESRYNTVRKNGRALIEAMYCFDSIARDLESVWQKTL
jgi:glycosyltransferase involved in cell wall biosynthesis